MILDDIRTRYPSLGLAVFAMEPGQPVTIETYAGGQVFSFSAGSVQAALAKAFPELVHPDCPNTGLPCAPGCDRKSCAGLHVPLDEWPTPDHETLDEPMEADPVEPAANVFD